jgi:AcrR family transcriptional regulator
MPPVPRPRLTPDDWLAAGLEALAEAGPAALGAEPLARRIGTTKGSFYWHFEDVPAFAAALLARWQALALADLDTAEADGAPAARLRTAAQHFANPLPPERHIRAWAATDAQAARTIRTVDAARLARLANRLGACGIGNPEMARILYAAVIGIRSLPTPNDDDAIGSLVDLVLALR